jgi:hypothetical protein
MELRPSRGGYLLHPFGCAEFVRGFLLGHGPYGSPRIDPEKGAPQADIFKFYKQALHREFAIDLATREEEEAAKRENRGIDPDRIERLAQRYLERIPYKLVKCRYHSFVVYFSNLKRLGWVEPTGHEEPSMFQEHYPPGPPRKYYRLTRAGREAGDVAWSNPLFALYGERWGRGYLRELRRRHKYITVGPTPRSSRRPPKSSA